jgi:hypothetical protein
MPPLKYIFHAIIVPCSILIPIFIFIPKFKIAKTEFRLLFYYLLISGIINTIAILVRRYHVSNLPLLHLYTIVEAVFLLSYFRQIFEDPKIKKILTFLIFVFPIICILNFSFLQSIYTFNTYTRPLEAILITFFCMLYLYRSGFSENWLNNPINWINMGILIYFPAACIIFILSNYFIASTNALMKTMVWNIHAALVLFMYLIWARGFKLISNGR